MANCITLNQTSYHGAGAIQSIPDEVKAHGLNKAFVCSDPDLIKMTQVWLMRFIPISNQTQQSKTYRLV